MASNTKITDSVSSEMLNLNSIDQSTGCFIDVKTYFYVFFIFVTLLTFLTFFERFYLKKVGINVT